MKNLKNILPKRTYRERDQPGERKAKFGHLEKHKDYKLRAKDHHRKEDELNRLRLKAALRNPDEFNFGMINAKTVDGVHVVEKRAPKREVKRLKEMKTQDVAFYDSKLQHDRAMIDRLQASMALSAAPLLDEIDEASKLRQSTNSVPIDESKGKRPDSKHVIFLDDEPQTSMSSATPASSSPNASNRKRKASFSLDDIEDEDDAQQLLSSYFDTPLELLHLRQNRLTNDQLQSDIIVNRVTKGAVKSIAKKQESSIRELAELKQRHALLHREKRKLVQHKQLMVGICVCVCVCSFNALCR